jgi:hypothetical protein
MVPKSQGPKFHGPKIPLLPEVPASVQNEEMSALESADGVAADADADAVRVTEIPASEQNKKMSALESADKVTADAVIPTAVPTEEPTEEPMEEPTEAPEPEPKRGRVCIRGHS